MMINFKRLPLITYSLLILIFVGVSNSSAAEGAANNHEAWTDAVLEARERVANTAANVQARLAQLAFLELSIAYPIQTDWVMQDLEQQAWRFLLPEHAEALQDEMLDRVKRDVMLPADESDLRGELMAYCRLAEVRRERRITDVLNQWAPLAFTEAHTFRMSFIGYTEGLSDARHERFFQPGTRLMMLSFEDRSTFGEPQTMIEDKHGMMRDVDVSFDQERLLFAWKKSDRLDDYHIYEYSIKDDAYRQLTFGLGRADYEPIYLPDGDIVFASTRPEQSVPCFWTEISNLYRMNGDGMYVRRLATDQVHTLYPQLKNDGRLTYTRWDYSDRAQVFPHPVFSMDPDGQAQRVYYGGNSWYPTSLLHTKGIPNSDKVMSIGSGHHTYQTGKLVVLDVSKGRDEGTGMELIAPKRENNYEIVDQAFQAGDQFRYPFPLSEEELFVSYRPDYGYDLGLYESEIHGFQQHDHYGLYWMNTDGDRELLYRAPDLSVMRPVAIGHRPQIQLIEDTVDYTQDTGTYYVHDVYQGVGLEGIPRGEAKKIRVVELDYRAAGVGAKYNHGEGGGSLNSTPVSIANATWDIKKILGDVDIEEDGSALFKVPAMASTYLQVLNDKGQVIQTTRTWDTLRPGEQKACVGCHVKDNANFYPFRKEDSLAWEKDPQKLQPFYGEPRGFSFAREVQPMLDRECVECHDGSDPEAMDLRGIPADDGNHNKRVWSRSYINLTGAKVDSRGSYLASDPEGGLVSWISQMSRPTELPPYFAGSAKSELASMLEEGHHDVKLTEEEKHKLYAWMDLLVPFSGEYREAHDWNRDEMNFYDYFEEKREKQFEEEMMNIAAYMEERELKPVNNEEAADFTRAHYRPVITGLPLQHHQGQRFHLAEHEASMIDHLEISASIEQPVNIRIIHIKNGHEFSRTRIQPGKVADVRFRQPLNTAEIAIEITGEQATIPTLKIEQAHGVLFKELPGDDEYRRHLALR